MKLPVFILAITAAVALAALSTARWFEDRTKAAGIVHRHSNRVFQNQYANIMAGYTALGASAAVADYDNDGLDDVYLTDSSVHGKNRLYRNLGGFRFADMAEQAGVAEGNDPNNATADALWFDYNNDGLQDLFVVRFGQSLLFENIKGRFRDVTVRAGLAGYRNAITAIAFDFDRDGDLDLFVGGYFRPVNVFRPKTPRFFPESFETAANGGGLALYRNNGNSTFTDITAAAGLTIGGWVLDLGHADADNDGDDDLYVACDFGTDRYFVNAGDGKFLDKTESAIGIDTKKGMNVDWGDFDNDGLLDVYVTNITDEYMREGNFLWRNSGDGSFTDVSRETGTHDTGWGWCGRFFDYDNDGWLDLYVVNGWVSAGSESYVPDIFAMLTQPNIDLADARNWPPMGAKSLSGYQKKRLFHNKKGMFEDHAPRHGLDSIRDGRGVAAADFDNDGRIDLMVSNANGEPLLYRNTAPPANWIELLLEGTKSNRSAVGAQIRIRTAAGTRLYFVNGGNGFASQSSIRVHAGLGEAGSVESVEIRWPAGGVQKLGALQARKLHRIREVSAQ